MAKKGILPLLLTALLLAACCACGAPSAQDTADQEEVTNRTWKTDAYTLALPGGFAAQKGEGDAVTLTLDGQAVGGVQVVPYPDAVGLLDTLGNASEDSRDRGKELMRQLSPEERLAYMMTVSQDGACLEISCAPDTPDVTPEEETMHYLFPQGDQFYDLYFQAGPVSADQQQSMAKGFALHP